MSAQELRLERPQDAFTVGEFFPLQQNREDIYRLGSSALAGVGGVPLEQAEALGFALDAVPNDDNL